MHLELVKVAVYVAKDLTPDQIRVDRIADNKTAELAEWDFDLLPIELCELRACNYDLSLLGFDQEELAKMLDPDVTEGLRPLASCDIESPKQAVNELGRKWRFCFEVPVATWRKT